VRQFNAGIVAGLALVVVQLLARLIAGVPTIVELVQDQLVVLLPGPVFSFVLDRLLYLGKPLFFGSLLVGVVLVLGAIGIPAIRSREPVVVAAALWLVSGLLELVVTGKGLFGGQAGLALASLVSFGAYAVVLLALGPRSLAPLARPSDTGTAGRWLDVLRDRRELVSGGILALAAIVLAREVVGALPSLPSRGSGGVVSGSPSAPGSAGTGTGQLAAGLPMWTTPASDFYVVGKNLVDPQLDAASWRLAVDGMVDHPASVSYDELRAMPSKDVDRTLECISNEVGGDLMSNGHWTGVPLGDVLRKAGAQPAATVVNFTCADGYTESMSIDKALDGTTFLMYLLDGSPLPQKHGFPVRVLGTGTYGMKNPKWLTRIEVARAVDPGFWERQGWNPDAIVQTMSRIDVPTDGARVVGNAVTVAGVAFAGDRGIQKVEISTDSGATWQSTTLLPPLTPTTWIFWQTTWQPSGTGTHQIIARAIDGTGKPQVVENADTFPVGATGYHQIRVDVAT
jgi:DMSO/TMAO reductase YedYZ molybdopterin-dependent catalytic subunit